MPDFRFEGSPGAVESKGAGLISRGQDFISVSTGLSSLSTEGWTGRAADRFRDKFDVDPPQWQRAGDGFVRAGQALNGYAAALRHAQSEAAACQREWERGNGVTSSARSAYDADVRAGRAEKAAHERENGPGTFTLTIHPFVDPGESIRAEARRRFESAKGVLDAAGHEAAIGVRAGTDAAPKKRNWLESGLAFVGGVLYGAGEAIVDILKLAWSISPLKQIYELSKLVTGELTPEEFMIKQQLKWETVQGMWTALTTDPVGFGKNLGKALLDWDTWKDDPARALGRLVPDAVAAVFTMGTGAVATRGASAASIFARRADDLAGGMVDAGRVANRMDDLTTLGRLEDLSDPRRIYSMTDGVPHPANFAPEQLGKSRVVDDLLGNTDAFASRNVQPWTRDDLITAINTPTSELTTTQRAILTDLRSTIDAPGPGSGVQKVLSQDAYEGYMSGAYKSNEVWGSVTRIDDTSHLTTPRSLHDGLRLDYPDTPFSPKSEGNIVLRYTSNDASYTNPINSDMGGATKFDRTFDMDTLKFKNEDPFTGNGFTKAADDVIPEFVADGARMREGAEMWETLSNGNQRLLAVLRNGEWIPQGIP